MNFKSQKNKIGEFVVFVDFKSMDVDSFVIEVRVLWNDTREDSRVDAGQSSGISRTERKVQRIAVVVKSCTDRTMIRGMEEFTAIHIGFRKLILIGKVIGTGSNRSAQ